MGTTPSSTFSLYYDDASLLAIGNDHDSQTLLAIGLESYWLTGHFYVCLAGIDHWLGTELMWKLNEQYHMQLYYKQNKYFKIVINEGLDDEYTENSKECNDCSISLPAHRQTLPIYTPLGQSGVVINSLKIESWKYDAADVDYQDEEEEYETILGHIDVGQDASSLWINGVLSLIILLFAYFVYYKCGNKNDKYIPIADDDIADD